MSKIEEQRKGFVEEKMKFLCVIESCTEKNILINDSSHGYLQIVMQF